MPSGRRIVHRALSPVRFVAVQPPVRWRLQRITSRWRSLPDYLLIGAMKGGTTSLFDHLGQSPGIELPLTKEIRYFSDRHGKGEAWYRSHFPRPSDRLAGEGTPGYLCHPSAPARAAALVPDARLVVLLRDPVQRAFSAYQHQVRLGREPLDLRDALAAEEARVVGADWDAPLNRALVFGYRLRGRYAEQLRRWLEHFPREQLLVVQSERFFADPEAVTGEVLDWLGAPRPEQFDPTPINVGHYSATLPDDVRQDLAETFAPLNEDLFALLGERFDWTAP